MALTRKMLKALGLSEETIETIIEAHGDTVTALMNERDDFKAKAEAADGIAKERDTLKEQLSKAGDAAKVQAEFDTYKAGVEKKEKNAQKSKALDKAFEDAGVKRDTFRRSMLKAWDMDSVELDDNGAIKDLDGLKAAVQKDYADFLATTDTQGVPPTNPPAGGGQAFTKGDIEKMSADEINKNWEAISKALPNLK